MLALGGADVEVVNAFPRFADGPDAFSALGLGAWFSAQVGLQALEDNVRGLAKKGMPMEERLSLMAFE